MSGFQCVHDVSDDAQENETYEHRSIGCMLHLEDPLLAPDCASDSVWFNGSIVAALELVSRHWRMASNESS